MAPSVFSEIENLPARRRLLLELLRQEEELPSPGPESPTSIPRRPAGEGPVLSSGQQRLWFIEQLQPGIAAYNVPGAVRIEGDLDTAVLEQCLREVGRRHEILRTRFEAVAGSPALIIDPEPRLELTRIDLRRFGPEVREEQVEGVIAAQIEKPFDLSRDALARTVLLHLAEKEYIFLLVLHHIICDIWSVGVFFRNTMAFYNKLSAGQPPSLPELPIQYPDYAAWHQRQLSGENLEKLLSYWRQQLAGAPLVIDLPTDHPRPAMQSFRGGRSYMDFSNELTAALKAMGRTQEASLYMILLAALDVVLYRYTGQPTLLVGVPMANRNRLELEELIGLLFNAVVMRADLERRMTFRQLLAQVRERMLGAFAHQELPFENLVDDLKVERDMSRNPIFQVLFAFQNVPPSAMAGRGLKLRRYEILEKTSREDLELDLRETPSGLAGWFGYDGGLFEEVTIGRLARHFAILLAGIVEDPERRLNELPLWSAAEIHQLLVEWNDSASAAVPAGGFPELFAAQVERTPEATAVVFEDRTLSYRALNARANRLARQLAGEGEVGPNAVVGLLADRSSDLLTAMIAVLKAGGAYLPLDPAHPAPRHALVLAQSRVSLVLAADELLPLVTAATEELEKDRRPRVVSLAAWLARDGAATPPAPRANPADLAYTIFTSGSTGLPKGAMVEQRGMVNHLYAKIAELGLGAEDCVVQTASQCFDISVWQFLAALLVGGRVHVLGDEIAHQPARLIAEVEKVGGTVLEAVPSVLRLIIEAAVRQGAERPALRALRWMVPTGEALAPELTQQWLGDYPQIPLVNAYGPTECSDDVTHHRLSRPPAPGAVRVPIGRPVINTRLRVVDRELGAVPIGVAGELCVGGICVGRGYLRNPAGTAEVFVPDPLGGEPGARLYRTGDRARWLRDGTLDFLGRLDHQVKIRGFRIELGEIETVLGEYPGVRESAVLVQDAETAAAMLVAYVAAGGQDPPGERPLREFLKERLPEYMVPAAFVFLDALPLTPNGKVDRRALHEQGGALPEREAYVAPRTPTEETLAAIWEEVLKVERIGAGDNFFEAGGQSLLATQVISRIREVFRVELPVRAVFQEPELAGLAAAIDQAVTRGEGRTTAPPITPRLRDAEADGLPLSFSQERLWFIDRLRPGLTAYNIFGAVRMRGALDVATLRHSFDELLRRHEVLRTTFKAVAGQPRQVVAPLGRRHGPEDPCYWSPSRQPAPPAPDGPSFELPLVDLRALAAGERQSRGRELGNQEAQQPFDLGRGPLIRGLLIRIDDEDHLLAVTAHHIVYDVWSRELLIRELGTLYEAFWHRRPSPLPELGVQYADFAWWQREWLRGEVLDGQLAYWKKQLAGVVAGSELPGDRLRPPVQSFRGARALMALSPATTAALRELSRGHGATLFMTLLAGFSAFLRRYTGEPDAVVGSPIANRNRAETEALIGFFVNTQVLRTEVAGDPSFGELLGRVREVALGAYSHQDLAFEQLVNQLRPRRDPSRQPLFQILFNFLTNYQPIVMDLPGLRLTPEANHSGAVQFDLILSMYEADGQLHFSADYGTDLYDHTTMVRMLGELGVLLAGAADDAGQRLSQLPLWSAAQRHQVLVEANDTGTAPAAERTIHQLITAQAARTPEAEAVVCGDERLTYAELDRRARRLAGRLRRLGAGPEVPVGVHLRQTVEMVVGLVGVLEAGAAYVPLDPSYPAERLAFMVADSATPLVVTETELAGKLAVSGVREVLLDGDPGGPDGASDGLPPPSPDNLAYVIYTSGSSGRPKGVRVSHRNLVHSTAARREYYGDDAGTFLLLSSFAFDSSVAGIFGTLCRGGRLILPPKGLRQDVSHLGELIAGEGVTDLLTVPSLYGLFVERPETASLRGVVVAGEACPAELVERHFRCCPRTRLWNEYGPTEGTVWSTVHALGPGSANGRVPIGRPIPNVRLYLLDDCGQPVPVGAPGELHLGGAGVAGGYCGRPGRTAQSFVPDPFGAGGERLYRTGDLARLLPSGEAEFLGRIDQQVKIHGFRVELEEIEAVLGSHRAVREAAVVAQEAGRLAAWIVLRPEEPEPQAQALRAFLKQRLPEYMVPHAYTVLDALPLTPSGKVDRRALSAAEGTRLVPEVPYAAPRTEVEKQLAAIWAELLEVERVGLNDNFFDLGGHSLLTTQLVSRLRDAFQLEVPLQVFFEEPTLGGLAEGIELSRWTEEIAQEGPGAGGEDIEEGEL